VSLFLKVKIFYWHLSCLSLRNFNTYETFPKKFKKLVVEVVEIMY